METIAQITAAGGTNGQFVLYVLTNAGRLYRFDPHTRTYDEMPLPPDTGRAF